MKAKFLLLFAGISLLVACGGKGKFEGEAVFELVELIKNGKEIDHDTTKNYDAEIKYYRLTEAPTYLKDSINRQSRIFLSNWFDVPETGDFDINKLVIDDMRDFYKQVDELDDKDCFTCRIKNIKIKGDDIYQNPNLISMNYSWYIYEGGAHGNYGKICYNYEKATGKKINYKSLVKDEAKLLNIAQKAFKEQNGIAEDEEITEMFQFENNTFRLNDNFGFTTEGITFYYNPYEIAPYAAGLIELTLTYDQLKGLVNYIDHIK
ncbi:MAG: DUF3298 and DUF4163 domain-containing protein [Prevotellaceae bacterium]|jgi:hypothetical protein|nr:DUF3298 and DUF4163 domain-containing protein [Prevotellaceae bacterium]